MFVLLLLCPWWLSLFSYIYVTFSLPIYSLSHLLSSSLRPPSQSNTRCEADVSTAGSASCRRMASARIPNWYWTQPVSRCPRPKPRGPSSSGAKWRTPTKVKTRGGSLVRSGTLKKRPCLWLVAFHARYAIIWAKNIPHFFLASLSWRNTKALFFGILFVPSVFPKI